MTVRELIEKLKEMPMDAYVVDESEVNAINNVELFMSDECEVRVCV